MPKGRGKANQDFTTSPSNISTGRDSTEVANGIVLSSTRRFVGIADNSGKDILATASRKFNDLIPGDKVHFVHSETSEDQAYITQVDERTNCLKRSYFGKSKLLAANINEVWIVIAPPPLFNSKALDRTIAVANSENIAVRIIANKSDLSSSSELDEILSYYESTGCATVKTSAKHKSGIQECYTAIENSEIIVVTGISGVGKSSILKCILGEDIRVGQVSEKTGQGKQTTSSAQGYQYCSPKNPSKPHLLIDLPGIQSFGVSHLSVDSISSLMPDIAKYATNCKFDNCSHVKEVDCGVKVALTTGDLRQSRYDSFLEMTQEIKDASKH